MLWLFSGLFAWNILFYTLRKEWYIRFNRDYWSIYRKQLLFMYFCIIPFMMGGFIMLVVLIIMLLGVGYKPVFYFKPEDN